MAAVLSPTASSSRDQGAQVGHCSRPWSSSRSHLPATSATLDLLAADHAYLQARLGVPGSNERVDAALKAVKLNPTNDMYRAEVGLAYQDQVINALTQALQQQQSGQDASQAMAYAKQSVRRGGTSDEGDDRLRSRRVRQLRLPRESLQPWRPVLPGRHATSRRRSPSRSEASRSSATVRPSGTSTPRRSRGRGRTERAIDQLKYSIKMDPRFSDASVLLASIYASSRARRPRPRRSSTTPSRRPPDRRDRSAERAGALQSLAASATTPTP